MKGEEVQIPKVVTEENVELFNGMVVQSKEERKKMNGMRGFQPNLEFEVEAGFAMKLVMDAVQRVFQKKPEYAVAYRADIEEAVADCIAHFATGPAKNPQGAWIRRFRPDICRVGYWAYIGVWRVLHARAKQMRWWEFAESDIDVDLSQFQGRPENSMRDFYELINKVPSTVCRDIITKVYGEGYGVDEVAIKIGLPPRKVVSLVRESVMFLRGMDILEEESFLPLNKDGRRKLPVTRLGTERRER